MTEDIMDQMRRWQYLNETGHPATKLARVHAAPKVMPLGDWVVWTICRGPELVNTVTRYPDMEF